MQKGGFRLFFAGAAVFAAALILCAGCGGAGGASKGENYASAAETGYYDAYQELGSGYERAEDGAAQDAGTPAEQPVSQAAGKTRKLIRSARLRIESGKKFSGGGMNLALRKMEEMAERHKGYIENSELDTSSLQCKIRVPSASFDSLLAEMPELGKIISRSENAEDVTIKYYDLEGRLATKKTLLSTFQAYLAKADAVKDILEAESRIADLQNEIDWLGTQLTGLANLIDYAAVSVYLFTPGEERPYSLCDRLARLFGSFGDFAQGSLIVLASVVVFGIPILILLFLAYWLLLGRVGLLKKAFRLVNGAKSKKSNNARSDYGD